MDHDHRMLLRQCKPLLNSRNASVSFYSHIPCTIAESHSSFGSIADLRTGGRWFDPGLGQYSFRGLMKIIATGFIPLSLLPVFSTMVM